MFKKRILTTITLCAIAILVVLFASCGTATSKPPCNHVKGEGIMEEVSDCYHGGRLVYYCILCNEVMGYEIYPETHNPKTFDEVAPTCTEPGYSQYTVCLDCGLTIDQGRELPPLDHDIFYEEGVDPTCTEWGYSFYESCRRCEYNTRVDLEPTGHTQGNWLTVTAPTCTATGSEQSFCIDCGHQETREIGPLGHVITYYPGRTATCTDHGYNAYESCSRCSYTTYVENPRIPHTYGSWIADVPATYESNGVIGHYTCSYCYKSFDADYRELETTVIPMKCHQFSSWYFEVAPGCTTEGSIAHYECYECDGYFDRNYKPLDSIVIPAAGHTLTSWHSIVDPTCTKEGLMQRECIAFDCNHEEIEVSAPTGHSLVDCPALAPTCVIDGHDAYQACINCEYNTLVTIPATGHDFTEWMTETPATCTGYGTDYHNCLTCGATETKTTSPLGHDVKHSDGYAPTCTLNGASAHDYCTRCDYSTATVIPSTGHSLTSHEAKAPTCTTDGYFAYVICANCDYNTYAVNPATGHVMSGFAVYIPDTCTTDGEERNSCKNCDHYESRVITATGHNVVVDPYVAPQIGKPGYTEGSHCSKCNEVFVPQNTIAPLVGVSVTVGNGLTLSGLDDHYAVGDTVSLSVSVAEGYSFLGWYIGETKLSDSLELVLVLDSESVVISAKSRGNSYTVEYSEKVNGVIIFNSMGGSKVEPMTENNGKYPIPTLEGYVFTGWYVDMALTELYDFSSTVSDRITLYAGWIRHYGNGVINVGETLTALHCPYVNSDHEYYAFVPLVSGQITFGSRNTVYDSCGSLFDENFRELAYDYNYYDVNFSITYTVEAGKLYYIAPYARSMYDGTTLDLYLEGSTLTVNTTFNYLTSLDVEYGSDYVLNYLNKSGYRFLGYYTAPNGGGTRLTDESGASLTPYGTLGGITVYAHYEAITYNVTLDYSDGAATDSTQKFTFDSPYRLPNPTRNMYYFAGWYYGSLKVEGELWSIPVDNITLTAKWVAIPVTDVTLEGNLAFDFEVGQMQLVPKLNPTDAYHTSIGYEIISGASETGGSINGSVISAGAVGEMVVRITVYGDEGAVLFTNDVVIAVYTTHIASLEIVNTDRVVNVGESLPLILESYPPTGYPRGEYIYQLAANTCGATVTDGVLTVTQPGSVRIRVRVDDSDWSSYVTFYAPTPISTAEQFNSIRNDLSGYYILTDDIDLSAYTDWQPIGYAENSSAGLTYANAFKGYVDGNGHKITGLSIDVSKTDYITVGLFGAIDNSARIENLSVDDYSISGVAPETVVYIGGMAGILNGSVSGGSVSGSFNINGASLIGGAVGQLFGKLVGVNIDTEITVGSNLSSEIRVGGAVAYYANGTYSDCTVSTNINVYGSYGFLVGAVAGEADGVITNVTADSVSIKASGTSGKSYAGLYVGKTTYQLLENLTVSGTLDTLTYGGTLYLGGVAGYAMNIKNCRVDCDFLSSGSEISDTTVTAHGNLYLGSIAGYLAGSLDGAEQSDESISVYADGSLWFGGLVGYIEGDATAVTYTADSIDLVAKDRLYYGGIAGLVSTVSTANVSIGSASVGGSTVYYGAIAGYSASIIDSTLGRVTDATVTKATNLYFGNVAGYVDGSIGGFDLTFDADVTVDGDLYYGGIVGYITGTVSDSSFTGNINATAANMSVGGIAGKAGGAISDAYYRGNITASAKSKVYVGGIVGDGGGVQNSRAYSLITVDQQSSTMYVGGIAGSSNATIDDVYYFGYITADFSGSSLYLGGIVGSNSSSVSSAISNAIISVSSQSGSTIYVGGISGYITNTISDSKADGNVTVESCSTTHVGGVAGYAVTVKRSYSVGDVTAAVSAASYLYIGGIAGEVGTVSECYYSFGDVCGTSVGSVYSGGIAGCANTAVRDSYCSYSYIVTDISRSGNVAYLGGIVGYNNATVERCYSMCFVDGKADGETKTLYVGGIAGYNNSKIDACYTESATSEYIREDMSVMDIETTALNSATVYVGGLVGQNGRDISNSYTKNTVLPRNSYAGGLVGRNSGHIEHSISYSEILGALGEKVGGFVGLADSGSQITDSYFSKTVVNSESAVGTGSTSGVSAKTTAELRGVTIYSSYDKTVWEVVNGKNPKLIFSPDLWSENADFGYRQLLGVINSADQHQYPIPDGYCRISFDVGLGEYPVDPIYVYTGEGIFLVTTAERIGYRFLGWYFDEEYTMPATDGVISFTAHCTLYAKWEAIVYDLTVSVEGKGSTNVTEKQYIYLDSITLTTDDVALDYLFIGWYEGDTLLSTDKTYTYTASARDQHITAKYLSYYDLTVTPGKSDFGSVSSTADHGRGLEGSEYTLTATPANGYVFVGWFVGDLLISRDTSYTLAMPSRDYALTARFTAKAGAVTDVWDGSVATSFAGGNGTESDPYLIATGAQLAYLSELLKKSSNGYADDYYVLTANIDLAGIEWTPIGYVGSYQQKTAFLGNFDGNGYTIYNMKITEAKGSYVGLFGSVYGADIRNLSIVDYEINIDNDNTYLYTGALAGRIASSTFVDSCHVVGSTSLTNIMPSIYAGGFIGYIDTACTVSRCYSIGNVKAESTGGSTFTVYAGGFAGMLGSSSKLTDSYAEGNVYAGSVNDEAYAGGLVGRAYGDRITNCFATGDVYASAPGDYAYAGGLLGYSSMSVTNCFATGNVLAESNGYFAYAGGLVGKSESGSYAITYSYATGDVSGTAKNLYIGGLVGYNNSPIAASYATGDVTARDSEQNSVGGFIGYISSSVIINDCYALGNACVIDPSSYSGNNYVGGFIGYANGTTVRTSYSAGDVTATNMQGYVNVGGFIASASRCTPQSCFSLGNVTMTGKGQSLNLGAFTGYNSSTSGNCYYLATVTVTQNGNAVTEHKDGAPVSAKTLTDYTFYFDTLGWKSEMWNAEFVENGGLPVFLGDDTLAPDVEALLKTYYQLFVDSTVGGSTNLTEAVVRHGDSIYLIATAATGYRFVGWYDGDTLVSTSEMLLHAPGKSYTLTARFENIDYTVLVAPTYDSITGVSGGADGYHYGDSVTLSASAAEGYEFLGWYINGVRQSSQTVYTFAMPAESISVEARYCKYFDLTADVKVTGQGSANGTASAYESQTVTVTATPAEGYRFFGWLVGDMLVSTDAQYTFVMPSRDYPLTATFTTATDDLSYAVWNGSIATSFSGGSGTADDPYLISTGAELAYLAYAINTNSSNSFYNKHYRLTNNISLGGLEWDPIGCFYYNSSNTTAARTFNGSFDGGGYVISDFKITTPKQSYYRYFGLFGRTGSESVIKNLGVENCLINVTPTASGLYIGALVGYNSGTVSDCYSSADIRVEYNVSYSSYVGGLVGYQNNKSVINSSSYGNVTVKAKSVAYVGGLVGYNYYGETDNCSAYNNVIVDASGVYVGGLVGFGQSSSATNCYAVGEIAAVGSADTQIGGLIGYASLKVIVTDCYSAVDLVATVTVSGMDLYMGGLIGYADYNATVKNCVALGDIIAMKSNTRLLYLDPVFGNKPNTMENVYYYDGQSVTYDGSAYSHHTYGTPCTLAELNSTAFYTDTLGWSTDVWELSDLDLANGITPELKNGAGKTPTALSGIVGESYYQLLFDSVYTNNASGSINLSDYILRAGCGVALVATPGAGYEFVGWFVNGRLVSESERFIYLATSDATVTAEFDLVRYTFIAEGESGISLTDPGRRHYAGDTVSLTATVADGYVFDGWFVNGLLVSTDLTYSITMPASTYTVTAMSTPIDYNLVVSESLDAAGDFGALDSVFNVGDSLTLNYVLLPGYRFLGWYFGDTLISNSTVATLTAPASDMIIVAKCEIITYRLGVTNTVGGSINSTGGSYTVVDEISLVATPAKSYEFLGWYSNGALYSDDPTLTFDMPADNLALEARFAVAYVEINVISGFNGSATGSTVRPKDTEITVTATPDEGYRLVGWYLNGELVSTSLTYTALYDVSGSYTLHAGFDKLGSVVTYVPASGSASWDERINDPTTYLLPYAYREGYIFDGWYLDDGVFSQPLTASVTTNVTAYAKWIAKETVVEMYKDVESDHLFEIYTRLDPDSIVWSDHLAVYDVDGQSVAVTVKSTSRPGYFTVSIAYNEGASYQVSLLSSDVYSTDHVRGFVVSFARAEIIDVGYTGNTVIFTTADVAAKKDNNAGVTLKSDSPISIGDLLYCIDDPDGCYGYVASVTDLGGGIYDVFFSSTEVSPESIFTAINVKQDNLDFDLSEGEIIGDVDAVMEAFADVAMKASSVNLLMERLTTFASKHPTFVFDDKPTVKADKPTISGKLIEFRVTITVNGKRQNSAGETLDEFAIRLVVGFRNELSTSCDLDVKFSLPMKINKFEFGLTNTTTVSFNLDLVYGNKEVGNNFDALETLLKDYKETVSEDKDLPFDTDSKHSDTFEAFSISHSIPLGNTGLYLKFSVTPFLEYQVIGQVDINTSFSVTNSCTVSYVNGKFGVYHNCYTNKVIEVYALAYIKIEVGLDAEVKIYLVGLENKLNATVNLKVGPYVEASGALVYEQHDSEIRYDLVGYVEWGYFYDWDVSVKLIVYTYSPEIDRVYKPLGNVGSYYLYFEFVSESDKYTVEEYTINLYDVLDHELWVFDLKELKDKNDFVADSSEYRYEIEENKYLYVNPYGQLKLKQCPTSPVQVKLYIYIGNMAAKTVLITVDVKQYNVTVAQPDNGIVKADKTYAAVGELVSFEFGFDQAEAMKNNQHIIVKGWIVNGEYIASLYDSISVPMSAGGITVEVVTETLSNVRFVSTAYDLTRIRYDLDATYVQIADIDMRGVDFKPIGVWPTVPFTGCYYGNGYSIYNLTLDTNDAIVSEYCPANDTTGETVALIGMFAATDKAILHELTLVNADVKYSGSPTSYNNCIVFAAAITALSSDTGFYGCSVINSVIDVYHSITQVQSGKGYSAQNDIGAICAYAWDSITIDNCFVTDLNIVSYLKGVPSRYSGSKENAQIGSFIGHIHGLAVITNCYGHGDITSNVVSPRINGFIGNHTNFASTASKSVRENVIIDVDLNCKSISILELYTSYSYNDSNAYNKYIKNKGIHYYQIINEGDDKSDFGGNSRMLFYDYEIHNEAFIYDLLGLDPTIWQIVDGKITKV